MVAILTLTFKDIFYFILIVSSEEEITIFVTITGLIWFSRNIL